MSKNLKLKNNFLNFIFSVDHTFSTNEKKLINLIIKNFDEIAEVGTAGGNKRAKLLNGLLEKEWATISSELNLTSTNNSNTPFPIKQLKKIEIENFRGFSNLYSHDFSKPYTLIYGTNGSGKTSFCEALEYSMLGYISEAESKRYDSNKYIVNLVTGKGQKPKLTIIDNNDSEIDLTEAPSSYHFCFIEKNRIDGFARISANTPSNQTELLAALLGLEDFNTYVSGFTEKIENYIVIDESAGIKYKDLIQKTRETDAESRIIETNNKNLLDLESEKDQLVTESKLEMTFGEIDTFLHGGLKMKGRLSQIDQEIQSISPIKYESNKLDIITDNCIEITRYLKEYKDLMERLEKSKSQISFKQLFTAIQELKIISDGKCPACLSPIESVVKNPFEHAEEKLLELNELALMEEKIELISENIISKTTGLMRDIDRKVKFADELSLSARFDFSHHLLSEELKRSNINGKLIEVEQLIKEVARNQEALNVLEELLNYKNLEYSSSAEKKSMLLTEREGLQKLSAKLKQIQTKESTYKQLINTAQVKLSEFDNRNEVLLLEVENEKKTIEVNKEFVVTYNSFLSKLKKYNLELPGKLISNLNDLTKDFYNEINKHDSNFELLEKLELPKKPDDKIIVYFKDNPNQATDALLVLSEGHVRCLGLSLLLSKIVKDNINIIIFDDVVNAIDDDHRGGIRELLFNNPLLKNKQIILTSHAEEFIKDMENQLEKRQYDKLINRITFLPPENRIIRTDNLTTSHYLTNAKHFLDRSQKRECLRFCRTALENINNSLWKKLGRTYNALISVQMRQPKGMPDTMSTTQGLSKFIKELKRKEGNPKFDRVIEIYDFLTGLQTANNTAWNYLNKGTHEEEELYEFDILIVKKIYESLEELDNEAKVV
ncbi:AAA family ATPase [Paenibacillus lautus]|uniref:AAA family ATPase n=1 Tax=Paenibacillus lautus TaxID=1401 RepID=UPI003D2C0E4D